MKTCSECGGRGAVVDHDGPDDELGYETICPVCGGSGEVHEDADDPAAVQT